MCDDAYKTSLATTIYFVGVMLGGLVFGTLSDRFGRKPILLLTMFTPALIGLLVFFIRDYIAFVVLGFLLQVKISHVVYKINSNSNQCLFFKLCDMFLSGFTNDILSFIPENLSRQVLYDCRCRW